MMDVRNTEPTTAAIAAEPITAAPITAAPIDLARFGPADPRTGLLAAAALAAAALDAVTTAEQAEPTPCEGFTVGALVGHLVGVSRRIGAIGRGEDPVTVPIDVDVAVRKAPALFRASMAASIEAWEGEGALERMVRVPWGEVPGFGAVGSYIGELTVHTWDLATAIGRTAAFDQRLLTPALAAAKDKVPAAMRGDGIPFGPVVPVADDAPLIDQLVGWMGRHPAWPAA